MAKHEETVKELLEKMGVDVEALQRQVNDAKAKLKKLSEQWATATPMKEANAALREIHEKLAPDMIRLKAKLDEAGKEMAAALASMEEGARKLLRKFGKFKL